MADYNIEEEKYGKKPKQDKIMKCMSSFTSLMEFSQNFRRLLKC